MTTAEIILGIILLIAGVFLVVAVLMQSSKNARLSGSIAGGAETFFGKTKGKTMDTLLNKLTIIVSIVFVVLVIVVYVIQPNTAVDPEKYWKDNKDLSGDTVETTEEATEETTSEEAAEEVAETEAE